MAKFSFVVKDREGKEFKNITDAPNQESLISRLQQEDYFIVSIEELTAAPVKPKSARPVMKRKFSHKSVKLGDLLTFAHQIATMLRAGVPLIRTMDVISTQIQSEKLFRILTKVRQDIEQGDSLSVALSKYPDVFNQFWVSLIEVGEASGTLPTILEKLASYLEQQAAFRSTVLSGILYPSILFVVAMGAVSFFALVVGPRFESIFTSMHAKLPPLTLTLLAVFKFIKTNFLLLIAAMIGLSFAFKRFIKTYHGKTLFEKFLFSLPSIGEVYKSIIIERFFSQMGILLDSGVPILYSLDITERLVNNNTCALIVNDIKEEVKRGELLVTSMEKSKFFPPMCTQMVMVGEETGELSTMLKHVSEFYKTAVATFMTRFSTVMEPIMLVFMGAVIGTIVLAMFLPLFNISQLGGYQGK